MAALQERNGSFRVIFRFRGKQHSFTLGRVSRDEAEAKAGHVDLVLLRIRQNLLAVPASVTIEEFLLADGQVKTPELAAITEPITFGTLREKYLETHRHGAMEPNSLQTSAMHLRHFERTLGEKFPLQQLQLADLQRHVTQRSKKKYRGRPLSPVTLKKEVATFRAAWNWAGLHGMVTGPFPARGLVYPKGDEKPPFMTWPEIERKAAVHGLTEAEVAELWDSLYLRKEEIEQLLTYVRQKAAH